VGLIGVEHCVFTLPAAAEAPAA
jgi:hypothetical protein